MVVDQVTPSSITIHGDSRTTASVACSTLATDAFVTTWGEGLHRQQASASVPAVRCAPRFSSCTSITPASARWKYDTPTTAKNAHTPTSNADSRRHDSVALDRTTDRDAAHRQVGTGRIPHQGAGDTGGEGGEPHPPRLTERRNDDGLGEPVDTGSFPVETVEVLADFLVEPVEILHVLEPQREQRGQRPQLGRDRVGVERLDAADQDRDDPFVELQRQLDLACDPVVRVEDPGGPVGSIAPPVGADHRNQNVTVLDLCREDVGEVVTEPSAWCCRGTPCAPK